MENQTKINREEANDVSAGKLEPGMVEADQQKASQPTASMADADQAEISQPAVGMVEADQLTASMADADQAEISQPTVGMEEADQPTVGMVEASQQKASQPAATHDKARESGKKLGMLIHDCGRAMYFHSNWGVRQTQILKMLMDGPMTQKDIQEKLGVKPATISEIISKLQDKKLVERARKEEDHRIVVIRLTEEGLAAARHRISENLGTEVGIPLSEEDKEQLIKMLEKLLHAFEEQDKALKSSSGDKT